MATLIISLGHIMLLKRLHSASIGLILVQTLPFQTSMATLIVCYLAVSFTTSFEQFLVVTALQTGAYAVAYAESSTQITT